MHDPFTDRTPQGAGSDPTPIGLDDTEALAELYDDVLDREFAEDDGLEAQMRARVRASEEDARAQASGRMAAAAKAVTLLQMDIADGPEPITPTLAPRLLTPSAATPAPPIPAPPTPAPSSDAPPVTTPSLRPSVSTPSAPTGRAADDGPSRVVPSGGPAAVLSTVYAASAKDAARSAAPLYELRGPSGADGEARGDNLVIFAERLEHRDRQGRLRQRLAMRDIVDTTVQRRIGGSAVVFRNRNGGDLVMRGLRPEVAEEIRRVVMTQLEAEGAAPASLPAAAPPPLAVTDRPASPPSPPPAVAVAVTVSPPFPESDLLRKLVDLHRAGVLDEQELAAKTEVVAQLARAAQGSDVARTGT